MVCTRVAWVSRCRTRIVCTCGTLWDTKCPRCMLVVFAPVPLPTCLVRPLGPWLRQVCRCRIVSATRMRWGRVFPWRACQTVSASERIAALLVQLLLHLRFRLRPETLFPSADKPAVEPAKEETKPEAAGEDSLLDRMEAAPKEDAALVVD
ncbi:unnamed protein product [Amoebophrya sp. A25]|nr:unnamed protein product [Amoebophrya sp. A25]|eukprot:GSA25T00006646001.1